MNKKTFTISLILICIVISSCKRNEDFNTISVAGEWVTVERRLVTNDTFIDKSVNTLIKLDDIDYEIKRYITEVSGNTGSIETVAINREDGIEERKRNATYEIIRDSIYIDDQKFEKTAARLFLSTNTMITYQKVTKKELDYIVGELGGDPNIIPQDIQGSFKMVEKK